VQAYHASRRARKSFFNVAHYSEYLLLDRKGVQLYPTRIAAFNAGRIKFMEGLCPHDPPLQGNHQKLRCVQRASTQASKRANIAAGMVDPLAKLIWKRWWKPDAIPEAFRDKFVLTT